MDFAGSSSPRGMRSSLPPSSAANTTQSVQGRSPTRQTADALMLGDDEAEEDNEQGAGSRRRRKPKGQTNGDVPVVKDAVGESVAESFETFLKT